MVPVINALRKKLAPSGALCCRVADKYLKNADINPTLYRAFKDADQALHAAHHILRAMEHFATVFNPDSFVPAIIFAADSDEYKLLENIKVGKSVKYGEGRAIEFYYGEFEKVAVAVAQHAFNKVITADALDIANGRKYFYFDIDSINYTPDEPDFPFIHTVADSDTLERALSEVVNFAAKYNFDSIKLIAAAPVKQERPDVTCFEWHVSRASMQMVYFNEAEEMKYRLEALDIAADEGDDDLRADLIAFAVNPKEV